MQSRNYTTLIFLNLIPHEKLVTEIGVSVVSRLTRSNKMFHLCSKNHNWLNHAENSSYPNTAIVALFKITLVKKVISSKRGKQNMFWIENLEKNLMEGEVNTIAQVKHETNIFNAQKIIS